MIYDFFDSEEAFHLITMYLSKYFVGLEFLGFEKKEFAGTLGSKSFKFKYKNTSFRICILKEGDKLRFFCGREHFPIPPMDEFIDIVYYGCSERNNTMRNFKRYLISEIRNKNIDSLLKH